MTTTHTSLTAITISRTVEVPDDQCFDVLTCALEGGIGYWAVADQIKRREDLAVVQVNLTEDDDIRENGPSGCTWHTMLAPDIRRGIEGLGRLIDQGDVHPESSVGQSFDECVRSGRFDEGDAGFADAVVQVAMFNEVRYG